MMEKATVLRVFLGATRFETPSGAWGFRGGNCARRAGRFFIHIVALINTGHIAFHIKGMWREILGI